MLKFRKSKNIGWQEKLIVFCLPVVIVVGIIFFVYYFVDPFPPRRISIGCGPAEGADFKYAQAYREYLSKQGIRMMRSKLKQMLEIEKMKGRAQE